MRMAVDRLTWLGLGLAFVGWVLLLANAAMGPFTISGGSPVVTAVMRADFVTIAEMLIVSGFGTAILGALRAGFGALHAFFDTVLHRANGARPAAPTAYTPPAGPAAASPAAAETGHEPTIEIPRPVTPKPQRNKNYTILENGAVEVETLLGTRVFASLDEARDYIR